MHDKLTTREVLRAEVLGAPKPTYSNLLPLRDRLELTSFIVCVVCSRPIEIRSQAQHEAAITLQVHLGECWNAMKRGAAP